MKMEQFEFIANVISCLDSENIKSDKINIHKFFYFLYFIEHYNEFNFEPYRYGPYSFELANTLNCGSSLKIFEFNDEDESYSLCNKDLINDEVVEKLKALFKSFKDLVGEIEFKNLEIVCSLMFCIKNIEFYDKDINFDNVYQLFFDWKSKYNNQKQLVETKYGVVEKFYNQLKTEKLLEKIEDKYDDVFKKLAQ